MNGGQQFRARSSGAPPLLPSLYAPYLPPAVRANEKDLFAYSIPPVLPLAAAGAAAPTFAVQADSDFLAVAINGIARDPADPTVVFQVPAITLQIFDQGAGRNLFDRAQDWAAIVGTAQLPGFFPYPKLIDRSSTVRVDLASLVPAAGQDYDVRLSLVGFKIFDWARGNR
jgi:hypothetical protein